MELPGLLTGFKNSSPVICYIVNMMGFDPEAEYGRDGLSDSRPLRPIPISSLMG
jgi:hypothetical protein